MSSRTKRRANTLYCVIVGDVINSKLKEPENREQITAAIESTLNYINTKYMDSILASFGLVRGDAFEGVLYSQQYAPKIIQEIIKSLYRVEETKVRISAVVDQLTVVSSDRNKADGPAFHLAVSKLEELKAGKSDHWLQMALHTNTVAQPIVDSVVELLGVITGGWTDRQREIVWAMDEFSHQQSLVSKALDLSPSVVNKQLKAANYVAYHHAWTNLEQYFIAIEEAIADGSKRPTPGYATYYSIAMRKLKLLEFDSALHFFQRAHRAAEEELGPSDPQLVVIYNGLARAYTKNGLLAEAKIFTDKSFALQEGLPKMRLEYARTLNLKGNLFLLNKENDVALNCYKEAKEIVLGTEGKNHPFLSICDNNIASVYAANGEYAKALDIYALCLENDENNADYDPFDYATTLSNMSICYDELGQVETALEYANKALDIREKHLPAKHRDVTGLQTRIQDLRARLPSPPDDSPTQEGPPHED